MRDLGFDVLYLNSLDKELLVALDLPDVKRRLLELVRDMTDKA